MIKNIKFCCYLDYPKRRGLKINTYAEAIYKTLNAFDDVRLKEEVDDYSKNIDINDGFEYAEERYKDLLWARKQVLNIATVGLYHLWEKAIRDFFVAELNNFMIATGKEQKSCKKDCSTILRASFLTIKKALAPYPELKDSLDVISELSQVVNVLKHGEGNSFYFLMKDNPSLINNNYVSINEKIEISVDRFRHYHQTLNEFWSKLPENLWIQMKAS